MSSSQSKVDTRKNNLSFKTLIKINIRLLKDAFNAYKFLFVLTITILILYSVLPYLTNYLNSKVVDSLIDQLSKSSTVEKELLILIYIYIAVLVTSEAFQYIYYSIEFRMRKRLERFFSYQFLEKFSNIDLEDYENPKVSDKLYRARERSNQGADNFRRLLSIFSSFITVVIGSAIFFDLNIFILLIIILSSIPSTINDIYFNKKMWSLWRENSESLRDYKLTRFHLWGENSLKEISIFNLNKYLLQKAFNSHDKYYNALLRADLIKSYYSVLLIIIRSLGFGYAFYYIINLVITGNVSIGLFTFYISSARSLSSSINSMLGRFTALYESSLYVGEYYEVLDLPKKIVSGKVVLKNSNKPSLIEFKNVSFKYPGTDIFVLKDLSLKIDPGQHLAIVGQNGAGKTTFIKLLLRFYDVTSGEVLIDGINIKDIDIDSYYKKIGALFQDYNFYHFDMFTNIGVGRVENIDDKDQIIAASMLSGSHEFVKDYPNKYEQILDKRFSGGINPSEGQKQKISLARTFFKNAPILILDEPTSAIDPKAEFEIFEKLLNFAEDKTVIIISHRFSTVRNADRIIVLGKGKIIEDGSHDELMKIKDGVYKKAFELQRKGYI